MLLFFESAFGICVGCKLYNLFNKEKAQLCPGNVCDIKDRTAIQKLSLSQAIMALSYVVFLVALSPYLYSDLQTNRAADSTAQTSPSTNVDEGRCRVPEFAKKMGHEEKWKLHNGC
jgi:hypothetical protein